ncbi:MAG TPA: hypothetical protein VEL07_20505 [Planctomycetota bacterium]|nr:hypothetical protein [Planctomycetota bacterium]
MLRTAIVLLGCVVALAAGEAATPWTGRIVVVESVSGGARQGDRREQEALAATLQERAARLRDRLRQATPTVARTLRNDLAHIEAELEQLAIERGGTVDLGRTDYAVGATRTLVDGDEARVVIDRAKSVAVVRAGGRAETVRLAAPPAPIALDDARDGAAAFDAATRRGTVTVDGRTYAVTVAIGLPNVYAQGLLPGQSDPLARALAALPGLPVLVENERDGVVRRWTVAVCEPGPIDDKDW